VYEYNLNKNESYILSCNQRNEKYYTAEYWNKIYIGIDATTGKILTIIKYGVKDKRNKRFIS